MTPLDKFHQVALSRCSVSRFYKAKEELLLTTRLKDRPLVNVIFMPVGERKKELANHIDGIDLDRLEWLNSGKGYTEYCKFLKGLGL